MPDAKPGRVRYRILLMLFLVTLVTFADRSSLSIAGTALQEGLGIDAVTLGYIFSAFGWAYVIGQIPGGWLFDRFGTKPVYTLALFLWSGLTLLQGFVGWLPTTWAVSTIFLLRLLVGFAGAPCFPGNARVTASWFPSAERATATAIASSAQYAATALFAPLMGAVVQMFGWQYVFIILGCLGLGLSLLWLKNLHSPREHPLLGAPELTLLERGGALVDLDQRAGATGPQWRHLRLLLTQRTLLGIYLGQYCNNAITYFFLTWFPVYLIQGRGMSIVGAGFAAAVPAISGCIGGVLGGLLSDGLLRRGHSLTLARKLPSVLGLLLSSSLVLCIFVDSDAAVVALMTLAFFGKGLGSLGWTLVADTAPRQILGLCGGLFNTFGNLAAVTTPIVIGYLVSLTGSFDGALLYVGANALLAVIGFTFIVGRIDRIELPAEGPRAAS
ncbi:putative (D)-galactarate transporter [Pseudomonas sp. 8Z]|uniref:D-galactonate transporter n=1 Tax=Pseudomonas sp. 8Z TaxID=2653166 RepID=UPI0012EF03E6|nr:D-galactonate transporter [Pseudomonas sp. 8Z]VXC92080.1 putative (D)-galactarate transporter [Pseudomonas sp. 8Z]